jgi:hypothetical protein
MRTRQIGQLLMAAIVLVAVIGLMVVAWGFLSVGNTRSSTINAQSAQALFAANAGLEYATYNFRTGTTCAGLNNVTQSIGSTESFTLTTTSFAATSTTVGTGGVTATATTIPAASTTGFPTHGRIRVDSEEIVYTGVTATSFTGARRGAAGTTANAHAATTAPISIQAQCLVRSTGAAGSASRILESVLLPMPWANFFDGTTTAIGTTATTLGSLATKLPTGNNLIIAAITLTSTNTTATTIAVGSLRLRNSTTATTLASNQFVVRVGGSATPVAASRPQKTHFIVARDVGAAANQTYLVDAAGNNANATAEVKIIVINVINSAQVSASLDTANVAITNASTTIGTLATTLPGTPGVQNAMNIVIASVQFDTIVANNGRTIGAGALILRRNGTALVSNQFVLTFEGTTNTNQEYSYLLLAVDSAVPANPTYTVTATASNNGTFNGETKIIVLQGPAGIFADGVSVALGTTATTLNTVASAFPALAAGANVAVVASSQYVASTNTAGPYTIAAGAENVVYNAVNQSTNASPYAVCNTGTAQCDHFEGALLWLQTFAPGATANPALQRASPSFLAQSAASTAARVNGESKLLAIQLEPIADRVEIFP